VAALLAAVLAIAAPQHAQPAQHFRVTLYFLTDGGSAPLGVRRTVERRGTMPLARPALQALLRGPPPGLTSAIPHAARIRSLTVTQGRRFSTARVDLAGLPRHSDAVRIAQVGTQITRTLVGLSDIGRVYIRADGRPWNFFLMRGGIAKTPWDYSMLLGVWIGSGSKSFKALP
jgi:hypothetical protein